MSERSVEISTLLARLPASTQTIGDVHASVTGISIDSRSVRPGSLYVAIRGERVDGHAYVAQAIERGASAVAIEAGHAPPPGATTVLQVPDSRRALASIAAAFYGDPSHDLAVVGVTGTNGKTTTTQMIAAIADAAGKPCGTIGTVGARFGERSWDLANTTPLPPELQELLDAMRTAGAAAVAMEVSSHALALERVADVRFAVAVLTNVTRDHLDFHGTLEAYAAAKHRLLLLAEACAIDVDDEYGASWAPDCARRVPTLTYALHREANLVAHDLDLRPDGSSFSVGDTRVNLHLPGRFNASNALGAIAAARLLGIDDDASARGLDALRQVPGRMETISAGGVSVVIDYAHTPDALENALQALRESTPGALEVVFGCGGDRDRGKRPQMGAIAARMADRVTLTSDNPRSEDPQKIVDEIAAGIEGGRFAIELDRRTAIERAVARACAGDVVLIAGKGHERYQIVGDRSLPFDDVEIARDAVQRRGTR